MPTVAMDYGLQKRELASSSSPLLRAIITISHLSDSTFAFIYFQQKDIIER
jgi:hypothetical protein